MKYLTVGSLVALATVVAASGASAQLVNGGFESWTGGVADGWSEMGVDGVGSDHVQETSIVAGGGSSAFVTAHATYAGLAQASLSLQPNTTYVLSAKIRGGGTSGDGADSIRVLYVDWLTEGGPKFAEVGSAISDDDFIALKVEFTTDALHASGEVQIGAYQDPASNAISFYLDDVALVEKTTPVWNGGFESWTGGQADGWVNTNEASSYVQESVNVNGGASAARVTPEATYAGIRQTGMVFQPGTTYTMSARIRGAGTAGDGADSIRLLYVDYLSDGGPLFSVSGGALSDDAYQTYTLEFTTDALHAGAEIQFGAFQEISGNAMAFYIDDVTIVEGTLPSDTTPPVISLNGPSALAVTLGETFVDPVTATDDVDGDLTGAMTVEILDSGNAVVADDAAMMAAEDTYTRTYNVSDAAGNAATAVALTVEVTADADMDGLPDAWEMQFFGTLDFGPDDDPDNDGYTNAAELANGTNPMADTAAMPVGGPALVLALMVLVLGLGVTRLASTRQ